MKPRMKRIKEIKPLRTLETKDSVNEGKQNAEKRRWNWIVSDKNLRKSASLNSKPSVVNKKSANSVSSAVKFIIGE